MRILVTGVKGQLGHDVVNEMVKRGLEPVGVDLEEMDITDAGACRKEMCIRDRYNGILLSFSSFEAESRSVF